MRLLSHLRLDLRLLEAGGLGEDQAERQQRLRLDPSSHHVQLNPLVFHIWRPLECIDMQEWVAQA